MTIEEASEDEALTNRRSSRALAVAQAASLQYRPVRADELAACAEIWRHSINDYVRGLNQPDVPDEVAPLLRLYGHLQATDPDRFIAATAEDGRLVAFASALVRERLWFLSMCFVLPEFQGAGVGRALLDRILPDDRGSMACATATDSAQPISNALYASYGIVPRVPLLNLIGLPGRPEAFGVLPSGIQPVPFETVVGSGPDGPGSAATGGSEGHVKLATIVDELDRELLGAAHPIDHRFLRQEGRRGWLYLGPDGNALGYGYANEAGRVGPVAVRDAALVAPILGHLTTAVVPRGAFALWLPGEASHAVTSAIRAGFRLDQFPILLCWDRPFADLARYLPISPGLL